MEASMDRWANTHTRLCAHARTRTHIYPPPPSFHPPLQVDAEDLVFSLESLVEKFGPEIAPYAGQMVTQLAAAYAKYSSQAEDEEEEEDQCGSRCLVVHVHAVCVHVCVCARACVCVLACVCVCMS